MVIFQLKHWLSPIIASKYPKKTFERFGSKLNYTTSNKKCNTHKVKDLTMPLETPISSPGLFRTVGHKLIAINFHF